ncbi:MAG: 50S ribosomal protein L23 [Methanobacteriaceae archaeon]|nr:50S ribosomal protein L23 [Methanobacteriaceae archaeon]
MDPYSVILRPQLSEKTMNQIYDDNKISFVVRRTANKHVLRSAFEELYEVKVIKINTHITPKGAKIACFKLHEDDNAEDIAVKMGVF